MKHELNQPCNECPYVGKIPGWIGSHDDPQEFVDLVRHDIPFACHMTVEQPGGPTIAEHKEQHCAGYAIFMTKMCKVSCNPATAELQRRLRDECTTEVLFPPAQLIARHTL